MRVGSLFAGIGGLDLGLEWAGMQTAWQVEKDDFCRRVLAKNFPNAQQYGDINEIDWATMDPVDPLCGGYPCQPFSLAGKRQGAADDRHLWPRMFEAVQALRPAWVVCENVSGHVSLGLDSVLSDLENAGYAWWAGIVPACAVGAQHRRDRVFIVAHAHCTRRPPRGETGADLANAAVEFQRCGPAEHLAGAWIRGRRHKPLLGRGIHGISRRVDRTARIRALGNAVVPQVAYQIGKAIMEAE